MRYTRKPEDAQYRTVSLESMELRNFREFVADGQVISTQQDKEVLEILKADGSREIIAQGQQRTVHYQITNHQITILNACPKGRLWVRHISGLRYKCPESWKRIDDVRSFCTIPDGSGMELCGDEYFNTLYVLNRG